MVENIILLRHYIYINVFNILGDINNDIKKYINKIILME
jgi:hypothetical protein